MDYKEKIRLAEKAANDLENGKAYETILSELSASGLYKVDVEKVMTSVKNILSDKYLTEVKTKMEQGIAFENIDLPGFDTSAKAILKDKAISKIVNGGIEKVKKMAQDGVDDNQIIQKLENPYFSKGDILKNIKEYKLFNQKPDGKEKFKYLLIGIPSLIVGLILFLLLFTGVFRLRFLAIFLFLYGIWNIYKAFTPKGVAELSDLKERFDC